MPQCIAAGSHIANHELESSELRPYAVELSKCIAKVRHALREQCFINTVTFPQHVSTHSVNVTSVQYSIKQNHFQTKSSWLHGFILATDSHTCPPFYWTVVIFLVTRQLLVIFCRNVISYWAFADSRAIVASRSVSIIYMAKTLC